MPGGTGLCAIHQPNFLPRLSTLAKLYAADTWVVLDDVQFARRDYQHRARLADPKNPDRQQWLSLPVHLTAGRSTLIRDATIADPDLAIRRTRGLIEQYYRRSPHWPIVLDLVGAATTAIATKSLTSCAEEPTGLLLRSLGWTGTVVRSSEFVVRPGRTQRLIDLTAGTGNDAYLCGPGGARYIDVTQFGERFIELVNFAPHGADNAIWTSARKISALWALARFGRDDLRGELIRCAERHR